MAVLARLSASLPSDLLERFEHFCEASGFSTRSDAIRQVLAEALVRYNWPEADADSAATLTLVYDDRCAMLSQSMRTVRHRCADVITSATKVHLRDGDCLEVFVLRGSAASVQLFFQQLHALSGIKQAELVPVYLTGSQSNRRHGRRSDEELSCTESHE